MAEDLKKKPEELKEENLEQATGGNPLIDSERLYKKKKR